MEDVAPDGSLLSADGRNCRLGGAWILELAIGANFEGVLDESKRQKGAKGNGKDSIMELHFYFDNLDRVVWPGHPGAGRK